MLMSDWSSDVCSSDLEGEKFVGFVEQLLDYAADGSFPILLFDHRCQGRIGARHVLELLEQFAIDPHPFGANLLLLLTRDAVGLKAFVCETALGRFDAAGEGRCGGLR